MVSVPKLTSAPTVSTLSALAEFPLSPTRISMSPSVRPPVMVEFAADSATPLMVRFAFSSDPPAGDHAEESDHSHDEGRTPPALEFV